MTLILIESTRWHENARETSDAMPLASPLLHASAHCALVNCRRAPGSDEDAMSPKLSALMSL